MNNQQIDKIINFHRINYQFHQPYQLILDGNFITLLKQKDISFKHKLSTITNSTLQLKVTSCILRELQLLGNQFKLVLELARTFKVIQCKHPLQYTADRCIVDQIGQSNEHFNMVCSQDLQLRRHLRTYQNVPIFYFGPDQRITMQDINQFTLKKIQRNIQNKFMPSSQQLITIIEDKKQKAILQKKQKIKQLSSLHGIQIKTKIVKGPNPLSIKKKQNNFPQPHSHQSFKKKEKDQGALQKRKRIRKRKNKSKDNISQINN